VPLNQQDQYMIISGFVIGGGILYSGYMALKESGKLKQLKLKQKKGLASSEASDVEVEAEQNGADLVPLSNNGGTEMEALTIKKARVNHYIWTSSMSLGFAVGAIFLPPLAIAAVGTSLYACVPILQSSVKLAKEKRINADTVDSVAIVGALAFGYYFSAAFVNVFYFAGQRFLLVKDEKAIKKQTKGTDEQPARGLQLVEDEREENQEPIQKGKMVDADSSMTKVAAVIEWHKMSVDLQLGERKKWVKFIQPSTISKRLKNDSSKT